MSEMDLDRFLQQRFDEAEAEVVRLKARVGEMEDEVSSLEDERDSLVADVGTLKENLRKALDWADDIRTLAKDICDLG